MTSHHRRLLFICCVCFVITFLTIARHYQSTIIQILKPSKALVRNRTLLLTVNIGKGRLGNKMFKYASLLGIAHREGRTPIIRPDTTHDDIESLFDLTFVDHQEGFDTSRWASVYESQYAYNDPVFQNLIRQNITLHGYLQSWKYFRNIQDVIRKEFTITKKYKDLAERILNQVRKIRPNTVHVGVHVRRPDQYSPNGTCVSPRSFFMNAFQKMKTLLPGETPLFIVAGNDLAWCRQNLASNDTFVLPSYSTQLHFAILASCRHLIVSVGSYGWWAGWLTGGRVIYYKKFPLPKSYEAVGFHSEDYYPPEWIGVDD